MTDDIENAIRRMTLMKIWYAPGERFVEPHAIGWSAKGNLLVRVYQTEGASASGEHENWKLLSVGDLSLIDGAAGSFDGPRPGYKRGDKAMKGGIIAEL